MKHGIILGALQSNPGHQGLGTDLNWISLKRSGGAHKIATFLRNEGWDVEVLDYWLAFTEEEFQLFCKQRINANTKFLGVSVTFGYKAQILELCIKNLEWFKKEYPDITIIAGSKAISDTRALPCDYYVTGFGEFGLLHLLNGTAKITEFMGKQVINSDKDHPCFPQKDLQVRYEDRDYLQPTDNLTLELSRGCKFKCKFCSYNAIGLKGDIDRDMDTLYSEMKENYDRFGITTYHIADETTNDSTEKLRKAAEQIKKLPFKPNLTGFIRADLLVSATREDDKKYLAEMGFWAHYYGIETYNEKAGRVIGKGMDRDRMKQGLIDIKDYFWKEVGRYRSTTSLIVGLPYETEESFFEGLDWHLENFPKENIIAFPLFINKYAEYLGDLFATSEFDMTWNDGKHFHDKLITDEEVGATPEAFPNTGLRAWLWGGYKNDAALPWSHDTFNWWTAHITYSKIWTRGYIANRGIMNWDLFNFTTPGTYDWDSVLDISYDNYDVEQLDKDTKLHIQKYKNAKLNV